MESQDEPSKELLEFKKQLNEELMSSEDIELFEDLNRNIQAIKLSHVNSVRQVPEGIGIIMKHLSEAKSAMANLPKQFTFMSVHLEQLKFIYNEMTGNHPWKKNLADLISVVSMISTVPGDVLNFRLAGTGEKNIHMWGMEYVKRLIADIRQEYDRLCDVLQETDSDGSIFDDLNNVALEAIDYCANNNAEIELCDLAMEIEQPEHIKRCLNEQNYKRVLLYVKTCTQFLYEDELDELLELLRECYLQYREYAEALIIAIRQNKPISILNVLFALDNDTTFAE